MQIIIDSGGTKALWVWARGAEEQARTLTKGIHPYFMNEEEIAAVAQQARAQGPEGVTKLFYYGTGCKAASARARIETGLRKAFPEVTVVQVDSDLLGAARALCQTAPGIACILGTGSNTCLYDGHHMISNKGGFGFILGDEGSGAAMGKMLMAAYLNEELTPDIHSALTQTFGLSTDHIIEAVYRQPAPNRYLAAFAPFILDHLYDSVLKSIADFQIRSCLQRYVVPYAGSHILPVHFTGSVAWHFRELVQQIILELGLLPGSFLPDPSEGLLRFHG